VVTNLIAQITKEISSSTIGTLATALGESPANTTRTLTGALPAVVGSVVNRVSTPEQASGLLEVISSHNLHAGPMTDVAAAVTAPSGLTSLITMGQPLLGSLLGGRSGALTDWLSTFAGVSRNSATSVLSLVVPLVLGQIGKRVSGMTDPSHGLLELLREQKASLRDAPAGLAAALSGAAGDRVRTPVPAAAPVDRAARRSGAWLWAIPLLALIPILFWAVGRRDARPAEDVATLGDRAGAVATTGVNAVGSFIDRNLPGNSRIRIPATGVEARLLDYIEDSSQPVSTERWFTFDRLEFEPDSARLRPSALEQLKNISAILTAYPNVHVKIGGYTDNTADSAYNLKLSADRATAAMNQIAALGIDRSRLSAEGFGEQHPVADNSTSDGRQRNRRVDIRVTQK
jgi:outer membrane protein OmpA-like peptidoglycan-associated protein